MASGSMGAGLAFVLALAMSIPGFPALADGDRRDAASARAVVDDGINLVVPEGATYNLSGFHEYSGEVVINGTLNVAPWDGLNESTGMLFFKSIENIDRALRRNSR